MNKRFVTIPRMPYLVTFSVNDTEVTKEFTEVPVQFEVPLKASRAEVDTLITKFIIDNCKEYFRTVLRIAESHLITGYNSDYDYRVNTLTAYTSDGLVLSYAFSYTCIETEPDSNQWIPCAMFANQPYVVLFDNSID